jgi:hypothetical protein
LEAAKEGYDGIFLIGPFNCLPYRISEAILKPLSMQTDMPLLTYESDGYAVSPSFLRQVEVHIEQVLERAGQRSLKTLPIKPSISRTVQKLASEGMLSKIQLGSKQTSQASAETLAPKRPEPHAQTP